VLLWVEADSLNFKATLTYKLLAGKGLFVVNEKTYLADETKLEVR